MLGESSRSKRQSRSSSKNSTSSRGSQKRSSRLSVVDWPEEQSESAPQATKREVPKLYGEFGEELSSGSQLHQSELKNKYGNFSVQHKLDIQAKSDYNLGYTTNIAMTPNRRTRDPRTAYTRGSEIDFVQTIRSGYGDGDRTNWKTTAADHKYQVNESGQAIDENRQPRFAHRAELTEQQTGTGWRVDQTHYDSPFHHEAHSEGVLGEGGRHHFTRETRPVELRDRPSITGPGYKFDAMSTAMDKRTGKNYGTLRWGFGVGQNERGEPRLETRKPSWLEDDVKLKGAAGEEARAWDRGRRASYQQWNESAPRKEKVNQNNRTVTRIPEYRTVTRTPEYRTVTRTPEYRTVTRTPEYRTVTRTPEYRTVTRTPD
jgi:hypothetical protein